MAAIVNETKNTDVYWYMFPFEKSYDREKSIKFLQSLPWILPFIIVAAYITFVFAGQRYMRHRKPFQLRKILFFWNCFLVLVSVMLMIRYGSQVIYTARHFGFHHSVCGPWHMDISPVGHFYQYFFLVTKVIELVDTSFIVLRKQPLYFLHWYHHSTVLLYVWLSNYQQAPCARWFGFVNITIHVAMYSYYALKAIEIRVPRYVAMAITLSQLLQMAIGCYITYYIYRAKQLHLPCSVQDSNLLAGTSMYVSYLFLFLWYFYRSYFCHKPARAELKKPTENKID